MRPLRLDMEGFGTFSKRATVDFTTSSFFALIGPTGSGKSTILDAMCFALYGRVPRWGGGSIEHSLAPSATTGRVQLSFRAGDSIYVATRVVKRSGSKAKVTTASAALEKLPDETTDTDLAEVSSLIGTPLAGSAKGVSEHCERVIGLPFDQFTKCVLLPQGAFAEFLHSSSADRRKILENLLGYSVYRDIHAAAGDELRDAETSVSRLDERLSSLEAVTDERVSESRTRIDALHGLQSTVRALVPQLDDVSRRMTLTQEALREVDESTALLTYIRKPDDVDALAQELALAEQELTRTRQSAVEAEETEQRLREEVAAIDVVTIDRQIADHDLLRDCVNRIEKGQEVTARAEAAAQAATAIAADVQRRVEAARINREQARIGKLAGTLRQDLSVGDDCPVCERAIEVVPAIDVDAVLAEAETRLKREEGEQINADRAVRHTQKEADRCRATLDSLLAEKDTVSARLATSPSRDELVSLRQKAQQQKASFDEAVTAVRTTRDRYRRAERAFETATARLRTEWGTFDHHRDRVARLSPPTVDRSDLAESWLELASWAAEKLRLVRNDRSRHMIELEELSTSKRTVTNELSVLFLEHGVSPVASNEGADYIASAASALSTAESDHEQLLRKRTEFIDVSAQRRKFAESAAVAKQLRNHLGAKQFINWLMTEALDDLVAGASVILNQITSGQYDLGYADNDFIVIDHHDADLTRPVKTLSGGETFAASLALALAMSKQLAGMSAHGANLEAILLDEGFGTLDSATLDQVAATLEALSNTGERLVGVVTHVQALAERIPVRFEVSKDAGGSRVCRVED